MGTATRLRRVPRVHASVWTVAALVALTIGAARATRAQDETVARLERRLAQALAEERFGALAVALDVGGQTLLTRGFGERAGRPVEPHSVFPAGSLVAQWIAAGVMEQVELGRVRLESRVGEHLEEFAEDPRALTVEHLLGHASGLPPLAEHPAVRSGGTATPAEFARWLAATPAQADAGHCFLYSDADTLLAGLILERVGGTSVREWIESRCEALEFEHTRFAAGEASSASMDGGQEIAGRLEEDGAAPALFGAQALQTSVLDLLRLQRAFVEGLAVSESAWARMAQTGRLPDGSPTHFGLGVALGTLGSRPCVRYGGRAHGARLSVAWYPELDLTVALLAEGDDAPLAALERALVRALLDEPDPELGEIALTPEERAPYLGDYYWGCTRWSIVEGGDGRLRAWLADAGERVLLAQGRHVFAAADDPDVRLRFEVDTGQALAFVLEEHGTQVRAVRIE